MFRPARSLPVLALTCLVFAALSFGDPSANGDAFVALLTGEQQVPSVTTEAHGLALFSLDDNETSLSFRVSTHGLDGIFASHLHPGLAGENGPPEISISGAFTDTISGTVTVDATDVLRLRTGQYYYNVHTNAHQAGEIRGQVVDVPLTFRADLRGAFERPSPVSTTGVGTAIVTIDDNLTDATWTMRTVGVNNINASHIHDATAGGFGGVLVPLTGAFTNSATGAFTVSSDFLDDLLAERLYVNVHTTANQAGEVRGQLYFQGGGGPQLFVAELTGDEENPPVNTAGRGVTVVRVDGSESYFEYWISVRDESGLISAHIHRGALGANGPVVVPFSVVPFGGWLSGAAALTPGLLEDLKAGNLYANVHNATHQAGVMRGQLRATPSLLFRASLNGLQEHSPIDTPATGVADLTVGPILRIGDIRIAARDIVNIIASHIHDGDLGVPGPVVHPTSGAFASVATTSLLFNSLDIGKLLREGYYVNVHTGANQGGEIRGQLGLPEGPMILPPSEDINGDGRINAADLLFFPDAWHGGPLD